MAMDDITQKQPSDLYMSCDVVRGITTEVQITHSLCTSCTQDPFDSVILKSSASKVDASTGEENVTGSPSAFSMSEKSPHANLRP